jgi:hypothetical protein
MAIENKWNEVPPQSFTADGSQFGQITLANTAGFFTKQSAYLTATGLPTLPVQIKRVLSPTTLIVGTINNAQIGSWPPLNISAYTVAADAAIGAQIQPTNNVAMDDIFKAVYQSDPTVALRVIFTDQYGNVYSDENPLPATFTGSISIGAVEVKGTNGNYIEPNPDGSLNVVVENEAATSPTIYNVPVNIANMEVSQLLPPNTQRFLIKVRDSAAQLQLAFESGESGTNYISVARGAVYEEEGLFVTGLILYFQTNNPSQIVEILAWS